MAVPPDRLLAVLTGAFGDLLAARGSALHEPMAVVVNGRSIVLERSALAAAFAEPTDHVIVLVHGLMGTVGDFQIAPAEGGAPQDYGAALAAAWHWTPTFVCYNSGLPIAENGAALADLLARLVAAWPVPIQELTLVAHSMGGLVVRHALDQPDSEPNSWRNLVRRVALVASPHGGAPLERGGRVATRLVRELPDPVAHLVAQLADLRSAGIVGLGQPALPPFAADRQYQLFAGRLLGDGPLADWLGDGMVPVASATAAAEAVPAGVTAHVIAGANHAQMAHHPEVCALLVAWLRPNSAVAAVAQAAHSPPAAAPPSRSRRWLGLGQLAVQSVAAGNTAVLRVRLARAEQVFAALGRVPALSPVVAVSRTLHDAVAIAGHAPVALATAAAEIAVEAAGALGDRRRRTQAMQAATSDKMAAAPQPEPGQGALASSPETAPFDGA